MKNHLTHFALSCLAMTTALVVGAGCRAVPEKTIVDLNRDAANRLAKQLQGNHQKPISKQDPILVATIADVDRLETSSSLGRIVSEQIASRLGQLGFNVTEVKIRGKLFVEKERGEFKNMGSPFGGEFTLSRDLQKIAAEHQAVAIIAGTYAVGKTHSIISLRAVEVDTKRIIGGHDYAVPAVPWQWINPQPEQRAKRFD